MTPGERVLGRPPRHPSRSAGHASLRERLHAAIPGGSHTYAKGDDQFPAEAPAAIVRGEGCRVWYAEGKVYVEYGAGLRAVTLGHAFPRVNRAVAAALDGGANFTRPSVAELECAEMLIDLLPPRTWRSSRRTGPLRRPRR